MNILELVRARLRGQADDGSLALAVDGGGSQGVVTAGMLLALEKRGILDVVDEYYGCSSGALNLALTLLENPFELIKEYFLTSPMLTLPRAGASLTSVFFNLERIDRAIDELLNRAAFPCASYNILLTDCGSGRGDILTIDQSNILRAKEVLHASILLPVRARNTPKIEGKRWCDGYLTFASSVVAVKHHPTSAVLWLSPKTKEQANTYHASDAVSPIHSYLAAVGLKRASEEFTRTAVELENLSKRLDTDSNTQVIALRPDRDSCLRFWSQSPEKLARGFTSGLRAGHKFADQVVA